MKSLDELAIEFHADKSSLEHDYCRHYEDVFWDVPFWKTILEFGVENGNSLRMWTEYAPQAMIIGVDSDPKIALINFPPRPIATIIGKQQDKEFLNAMIIPLGPFDLIVDDASHRSSDQITTFNVMWPHVSPGGFYSIEDLQTSFLPEYTLGHPGIYPWLTEKVTQLHSSDLMGRVHNPGDIDMIYLANDLVIFRKSLGIQPK